MDLADQWTKSPPGADAALLIVWHSRTGASQQMAQAAFEGAASVDAQIASRIMRCDRARPADLTAARGYLFVCPENLGSVSGLMKEFFDRCYYPLLDEIAGRAYASLVCAGSDGQGAQRQIARIATGWRLNCISEPQIIGTAAQTAEQILAPKRMAPAQLALAHDLGAAMADATAMGIY